MLIPSSIEIIFDIFIIVFAGDLLEFLDNKCSCFLSLVVFYNANTVVSILTILLEDVLEIVVVYIGIDLFLS